MVSVPSPIGLFQNSHILRAMLKWVLINVGFIGYVWIIRNQKQAKYCNLCLQKSRLYICTTKKARQDVLPRRSAMWKHIFSSMCYRIFSAALYCSSTFWTFLSIRPGMLISSPHSAQTATVIVNVYFLPLIFFTMSFFRKKYSVSFLHSVQKSLFPALPSAPPKTLIEDAREICRD